MLYEVITLDRAPAGPALHRDTAHDVCGMGLPREPGDPTAQDRVRVERGRHRRLGKDDDLRPSLGGPARQLFIDRRITSYNVCYTKLLRDPLDHLVSRAHRLQDRDVARLLHDHHHQGRDDRKGGHDHDHREQHEHHP